MAALSARRLGALARHLQPAAAAAAAAAAVPIHERRAAARLGLRGGTANGLGLQVWQNADGSVSEEALADVLEQKRRAVALAMGCLESFPHSLILIQTPLSIFPLFRMVQHK